jgi:hypothetical protein
MKIEGMASPSRLNLYTSHCVPFQIDRQALDEAVEMHDATKAAEIARDRAMRESDCDQPHRLRLHISLSVASSCRRRGLVPLSLPCSASSACESIWPA